MMVYCVTAKGHGYKNLHQKLGDHGNRHGYKNFHQKLANDLHHVDQSTFSQQTSHHSTTDNNRREDRSIPTDDHNHHDNTPDDNKSNNRLHSAPNNDGPSNHQRYKHYNNGGRDRNKRDDYDWYDWYDWYDYYYVSIEEDNDNPNYVSHAAQQSYTRPKEINSVFRGRRITVDEGIHYVEVNISSHTAMAGIKLFPG